MGYDTLKYRKRLSTSVDSGLYKAIYNYSLDSKIPLSRLLDEALTDYLQKKEIQYEIETPSKRVK